MLVGGLSAVYINIINLRDPTDRSFEVFFCPFGSDAVAVRYLPGDELSPGSGV
jgi:hypothetical protein